MLHLLGVEMARVSAEDMVRDGGRDGKGVGRGHGEEAWGREAMVSAEDMVRELSLGHSRPGRPCCVPLMMLIELSMPFFRTEWPRTRPRPGGRTWPVLPRPRPLRQAAERLWDGIPLPVTWPLDLPLASSGPAIWSRTITAMPSCWLYLVTRYRGSVAGEMWILAVHICTGNYHCFNYQMMPSLPYNTSRRWNGGLRQLRNAFRLATPYLPLLLRRCPTPRPRVWASPLIQRCAPSAGPNVATRPRWPHQGLSSAIRCV